MHDLLRGNVHAAAGKHRQPSTGIIDSTIRQDQGKRSYHGYDADKNVNGRKHYILVDTSGLFLAVVVTAASVHDRDGAKRLLAVLRHNFSRLWRIWADGAYADELLAWVCPLRPWCKAHPEIVKRAEGIKGFHLIPNRWYCRADLRLVCPLPPVVQLKTII